MPTATISAGFGSEWRHFFPYKTTNISVRVLFAGNDRLQNVLAADDPDGLVALERRMFSENRSIPMSFSKRCKNSVALKKTRMEHSDKSDHRTSARVLECNERGRSFARTIVMRHCSVFAVLHSSMVVSSAQQFCCRLQRVP
jgi:hypothetical protein